MDDQARLEQIMKHSVDRMLSKTLTELMKNPVVLRHIIGTILTGHKSDIHRAVRGLVSDISRRTMSLDDLETLLTEDLLEKTAVAVAHTLAIYIIHGESAPWN